MRKDKSEIHMLKGAQLCINALPLRPLIIVAGCHRSGTTIMFRSLRATGFKVCETWLGGGFKTPSEDMYFMRYGYDIATDIGVKKMIGKTFEDMLPGYLRPDVLIEFPKKRGALTQRTQNKLNTFLQYLRTYQIVRKDMENGRITGFRQY